MTKLSKSLLYCLLSTNLLASSANAGIINWQLQDVMFSDGGVATGFFSYDTNTNELINPLIRTSGSYNFVYDNVVVFNNFAVDFNTGSTDAGTGFLQLTSIDFGTTPLFANPGEILLGRNTVDTNMYSWESVYVPFGSGTSHGPVVRTITSGYLTSTITPVSEPPSILILVLGCGALILFRRRHNEKARLQQFSLSS